MVNATFPINYFTSNTKQGLNYALSTSSTTLDSGANNNILYVTRISL